MVARWAHNPKVASSSLASATIKENASGQLSRCILFISVSQNDFRFPARGIEMFAPMYMLWWSIETENP